MNGSTETKPIKRKTLKNSKTSTTKECYTIAAPAEMGWFSWREHPVNEAYLRALCEQLLNWAHTDSDAFDIDEFFENKRVWDSSVNRWGREHEFVRDAVEQAKRILGTRRHKTAFKRITDGSIMLKTQHMFKKEWHNDVNKYHSDMKKDEEGSKKQDVLVVYGDASQHHLVDKALAENKKI